MTQCTYLGEVILKEAVQLCVISLHPKPSGPKRVTGRDLSLLAYRTIV